MSKYENCNVKQAINNENIKKKREYCAWKVCV